MSRLLAFRAANVRSFRDELELSLLATALADEGVPRSMSWREGGRLTEVLPVAGVFGANASGKSNLFRAMNDMRRHVLYSFSRADPDSGMRRNAFRLDSAEKDASRFEIDLILDGVLHEYGFVMDDAQVLEEWAYRYPRGKSALLFRREKSDVTLGGSNRAKGRAVMEILRPNSLLLSAAAAANHPDLAPLRRWFADNLLLADASSRGRRWAFTTGMLQQEQRRDQVLGLLKAADLGITDVRVREAAPELLERVKRATEFLQGREDEPEDKDAPASLVEQGVVLSHRGSAGTIEFDADEESLGTMALFELAGPVIHALANGSVLLVDEIEASLHPALVRQLVRLFQDAETNPNGGQLIFNSHEASLLGDSSQERTLGRDQVWFTEKGDDGASRLYPLSDLRPRSDEAIGRRYAEGKYGAVPTFDEEEFTEVGLSIADDSG
ncbi:MAG TPA: ATP-binding protein [Trebonia sp.]